MSQLEMPSTCLEPQPLDALTIFLRSFLSGPGLRIAHGGAVVAPRANEGPLVAAAASCTDQLRRERLKSHLLDVSAGCAPKHWHQPTDLHRPLKGLLCCGCVGFVFYMYVVEHTDRECAGN
jgi:hypothetical protein